MGLLDFFLGGGDRRDPYQGEANRARGRSRQRGERLTGEYETRATDYDPYEASQRASVAAGEELYEDFGRQFRDLRGSQVGRGRLGTGYGEMDEMEAFEGFEENLANILTQNSLRAAGLDLQNIQGIGRQGAQSEQQHLDQLYGERDRWQDRENARRRRQASLWGGLAKTAGTVGGFLLGGPAGAGAGYKIGEAVS